MYYIVRRTSQLYDSRSPQPCEEAVTEALLHTETVFTDTPFWKEHEKDWWNASGYDHYRKETITHLGDERLAAKRDYIQFEWVVDLESMDDLLNFINKYKRVVIQVEDTTPDYPVIEIYDDWRE